MFTGSLNGWTSTIPDRSAKLRYRSLPESRQHSRWAMPQQCPQTFVSTGTIFHTVNPQYRCSAPIRMCNVLSTSGCTHHLLSTCFRSEGTKSPPASAASIAAAHMNGGNADPAADPLPSVLEEETDWGIGENGS